MKARRSAEAAFVARKPLSSGAGRGGCQRCRLAWQVGATGRDVSTGQPGGERHALATRSAEAIIKRSGRADEEVNVTRQGGGEYDAPRPGRNHRTHSTFFLTHSIPILSNEGGG